MHAGFRRYVGGGWTRLASPGSLAIEDDANVARMMLPLSPKRDATVNAEAQQNRKKRAGYDDNVAQTMPPPTPKKAKIVNAKERRNRKKTRARQHSLLDRQGGWGVKSGRWRMADGDSRMAMISVEE